MGEGFVVRLFRGADASAARLKAGTTYPSVASRVDGSPRPAYNPPFVSRPDPAHRRKPADAPPMPTPLLVTEHLGKHYGRLKAVDDLSLSVEEGDLFGLLGLNGAGKTTTLRVIVDLLRPTGGRVLLFGREAKANHAELMRDVGALIEIPAFYPYLTARQNLDLLGRMHGGVNAARISEVLEWVDLAHRADDVVRGFSQGMRQRLGIAQAFLARPKLVLLDEPTNGLDPQGIAAMRALLVRLHRETGVTVFLSSHLLAEVEQLCTRVAILVDGRLKVQGKLSDLLAGTAPRLRMRVDDVAAAKAALEGLSGLGAIQESGPGALEAELAGAEPAAVNARLTSRGVAVSELVVARQTLEEYFMRQATDGSGRMRTETRVAG